MTPEEYKGKMDFPMELLAGELDGEEVVGGSPAMTKPVPEAATPMEILQRALQAAKEKK